MITPQALAEQYIGYLKEEGLLEHLPAIVKELEKEAFRNQEITLISAVEIPQSEMAEIEKMLFEKWGEHPILTVVDPAIFSGMIIRFGYQVIDLSGKHQLKKLASHLEN